MSGTPPNHVGVLMIGHDGSAEGNANAQLAITAPDLLAALEEQVAEFDKRMREYVEGDDLGVADIAMKHHGARMDRSRAVIAKARGGR